MIMMSILAVLNRLVCVRSCRKYLRKEILPPLGKVTKRPEEETHLIKSKVKSSVRSAVVWYILVKSSIFRLRHVKSFIVWCSMIFST